MSSVGTLSQRIAAAPISWGVCEVPGWGAQLEPRRVLGEMRDLGIRATELGAIGWLPSDGGATKALLDEFGLSLVGGFVPLVLHEATRRDAAIAAAAAAARHLAAAGGTYFVTAVISSHEAWERPELGAAEWATLFAMLTELDRITADHGLVQAVHPHVNTLIETASEVDRFLDNCASPFTLDTGHLYLGGADPVMIARRHHERVALVHIKDIDARVAQKFLSGKASLMDSVDAGLFPNAGDGVAPIAATIDALREVGYSGWYVLEQDITLTGDLPAPGEGPVLGVRSSIEYLRSLDA